MNAWIIPLTGCEPIRQNFRSAPAGKLEAIFTSKLIELDMLCKAPCDRFPGAPVESALEEAAWGDAHWYLYQSGWLQR